MYVAALVLCSISLVTPEIHFATNKQYANLFANPKPIDVKRNQAVEYGTCVNNYILDCNSELQCQDTHWNECYQQNPDDPSTWSCTCWCTGDGPCQTNRDCCNNQCINGTCSYNGGIQGAWCGSWCSNCAPGYQCHYFPDADYGYCDKGYVTTEQQTTKQPSTIPTVTAVVTNSSCSNGLACADMQMCNEEESCWCLETSNGGGFCARSAFCSELSNCSNCPNDLGVCVINSCCFSPICYPYSYACPENYLTKKLDHGRPKNRQRSVAKRTGLTSSGYLP